jgi:hypothetical protein
MKRQHRNFLFLNETMKRKNKQQNTTNDEKTQQNNNQQLTNPKDGMKMGRGVEDGQYLFSKPSKPTG